MSRMLKNASSYNTGDPWENLANAIIIQAADDYLASPETRKRQGVKLEEVESFFSSSWFGVLTGVNPKQFVTALDKQKRLRAQKKQKLRNK